MLKIIFVGVLIGTASVMPGVSGGTMAVAMGIYDKLIYAFTHLLKDFNKSIRVLMPVAIGMAIGTVGLSFIIEILFDVIPFQTNLLFIGLIIGGLPGIWKKMNPVIFTKRHIIAFLITLLIVIFMAFMGDATENSVNFEPGLIQMIEIFAIGLLASATMVIPGVSGSMLLILLGYYTPLIQYINDFIRAALALDISKALSTLNVLIPFGIGIFIGAIVISKLVEIIFSRFPNIAYSIIIGLIVATPIAIIGMNKCYPNSIFTLITGILALAFGLWATGKLGD